MALHPLNPYRLPNHSPQRALWKTNMAEMLKKYLRGEPVFVAFDKNYEPKREGSVGRLKITNVQCLLHGEYEYYRHRYGKKDDFIEEIPENVKEDHFESIGISGHIVWDKRSNKVQATGWGMNWDDARADDEGTVWAWAKDPEPEQVVAEDKLGREIKVGDFISYILYHFDNGSNGAGIYYGKVTKITKTGTVHAKNIKLKDNDHVAEMRIKDNSLIVIMSKDLLDKLMLARLSIL